MHDCFIQDVALQIWDPSQLFGAHPRKCPARYVGADGEERICGGCLQKNGRSPTLKMVKGIGAQDRDVYIMTRKWQCTAGKQCPTAATFHVACSELCSSCLYLSLSIPIHLLYRAARYGEVLAGHGR